jgi:hypothetical protein
MRNIEDIENTIRLYPTIFDGLNVKTIEKFIDWYPSNMHVINAFEREAVFLKLNGKRERYSAYTIREKLRWDSLLKENASAYKLNNNFSPCIARILMYLNPELNGMFNIREAQIFDERTTEDFAWSSGVSS